MQDPSLTTLLVPDKHSTEDFPVVSSDFSQSRDGEQIKSLHFKAGSVFFESTTPFLNYI